MQFDCLVLYPVNPKQLARFREVLHPSMAKDDPGDAQALAELLAKHGDYLRAWQPDDEQTRKIRMLSEDRRSLVDQRTALTNALKSRLKQYFPLALHVTGDRLFGHLACEFLLRYPTLEELQTASEQELIQFYRDHRSYRQELIAKRLEQIQQARPLTTDGAITESSVLLVQNLVKQIMVLNDAIDLYEQKLASLMRTHPDAELFQSFPGAGAAMAPRLLAAMGSDRDRFASAQEIQQITGIAPVTRQSGKSKVVYRRWACNRFLLQTYHEFAAHSLKYSAWAKAYYNMVRDKGKKHQAAVRALAFKWIRIIFRCWQTNIPYNELIYTASLIKRKSPLVRYMASNES
jgi:transposase